MLRLRPFVAAAFAVLLSSCVGEPGSPTEPMVVSAKHKNSSLAPTEIRTIYGPSVYTRTTAQPVTTTFTLAGFGSAATLTVTNGSASGADRVTSGTIAVDGVEVVHESQFGKKVASIVVPITLLNSSTVSIRLAGAPGSSISVSVDGTLATTATTTADGGVVHLLGDQVQLTIPAGAVAQPINLTAVPTTSPSEEAAAGTSIELGPTGTTFTTPITISIAYDPAALPAGARPASLQMYFWNTDHWQALPGNVVDLAHSVVSAQTTHFTTFALLPNEVEFCQSDPTSEQDLQTAIHHVPVGGRVFVCDGRQTANQVTIDRPVTIEAEHAGLATLVQPDTTTSSTAAILNVTNVPSGTISIVNMVLESKWIGLFGQGAYDQLVVTGTHFHGTVSAAGLGVNLQETSVPTAKAVFDHDEFTGSSQGLLSRQPVDIDVTNNNFHDIGTFALIVYSANGSGNPIPAGFSAKVQAGRVLSNTFHNCGTSVCIAMEAIGRDTVRFNSIIMDVGSLVDGILVNRTGQNAAASLPSVFSDNTVTGLGPAAAADSSVQTNWGVRFALRMLPGAVTVTDEFARNTINGAFVAIDARGPMRMSVFDNHISNVYGAISIQGSDPIDAHRNDIVGYHYPISGGLTVIPANPVAVAAIPARLTCNYWGSNAGPVGIFSGVPITSYSPFSAVSIADQPAVVCDPNAISMTIRACATPGGGFPTVPTILDAYNSTPVGGTVLVCDGTFPVNSMTISKSITITAEGPGMPTIDAGANQRAFTVSNVAGGPVTISKLRFTGGTLGQLNVGTNAGTVTLSQNELHPNQTNAFGVLPVGTNTAINVTGNGLATVAIDQNAILGGDLGIVYSLVGGAHLTVTNNTFSGQVNNSLVFSSLSLAASISVTGNHFSDCGPSTCLFLSQPATVQGNTFTAHVSRRMTNLIVVSIPATLTTQAAMITGNTVTGLDLTGGSRSFGTTYPLTNAIFVGAGSAVITGNTIANAFFGITAQTAAGSTATDNVITTTFAPFANATSPGVAALTANWNDAGDYVAAVGQASGFNLGAFNIRCNWWGQAAGPIGMPGSIPPATYTPFAAAPVAGGSHSGCAP